MKIRIIFECSGCGSTSYRPSTKWTFKDNFLHKFGIWPQRCYRCRRRFYLYRPALLNTFLRALAAPPAPPAPQQPEIARAAKAAHSWSAPPERGAAPVKTDVVWSTFAEADQGKGRS
jgi:hypothetical protein